ncbi:alpha/beta fold hydrolase [Cumulibacter manganitolerans]|uniref:alpha/beta fold hydrolase n=1 Tax=Cumulibacter manganitolerans TaxID=1884992 RepID=UPI0012960658|nr:alpha/beta fold hydrolase [Cumulibacter manganitolerans]
MTYSLLVPGIKARDHSVVAPLRHDEPGGETIEVYAREVVGAEHDDPAGLPWLLFLQGGPGGAAPRPTARGGWLDAALQRYRVLLLDQRGTGRSTPVGPSLVRRRGADGAADYVAALRADAIVRDAELLRAQVADGQRWSTLGQSYGGFCTFSYLSFAPEGLERCLVTGGIPPIGLRPEDVYRRTWMRVIAKNGNFFRAFPDDRARLDALIGLLPRGVELPDGGRLTVERLLALGIDFGKSDGFAAVHYLLEQAVADGEAGAAFLGAVAERTGGAAAPLYALLQEAIYCDGPGASRWAATRTRAEIKALSAAAAHPLFTGEMMERWRFTDVPGLAPYAEVADRLHAREDWPALYDPARLAHNEVPVAAAVYFDDMYVDADASLAVARRTPGVRAWITNQYEHDGLRADAAVFERLDRMTRGMA